MAIRLRVVDGCLVALCAARSLPKDGDIYLDDNAHHALTTKFALDFNQMRIWECTNGEDRIPVDERYLPIIEQEESENVNREWWDMMYG